MDSKLLKTFLLVAKLLNITKAAEQLSFSQPAITAQICSLEDELQVQLFQRNGKRLALTEAGEKMVDYAQKIVGLSEEARNDMAVFSRPVDMIRLGVSTQMANYFLPELLMDLKKQMPHIHISVDVCMYQKEVIKGLLEHCYDLGFIHGKNNSKQICQHRIWTEEVWWVASTDFMNQQPKEKDIKEYPIINFTKGCGFRTNFEEQVKTHAKFNSSLEYSDSEAVKRAVLSGLGIAYLPKILVAEEVERGNLIVLENAPQMEFTLSLVHLNKKTFTIPMYALLLAIANLSGVDQSIKELL